MSHPLNPPIDTPIKIRPYESYAMVSAIFAALAIVMPALIWYDGHTQNLYSFNLSAMSKVFVICLIPSLIAAYYYNRTLITADSNGLEIRGLRDKQFAYWSEIEDYEFRYAKEYQRQSNTPDIYIKTKGVWHKLITNRPDAQPLLDYIAKKATHSQSRSWQDSDIRPESEWPKTFAYPNTPPRSPYHGFSSCFIHFVIISVLGPVSRWGAFLPWLKLKWSGLSLTEQILVVVLAIMAYGALTYLPKVFEQNTTQKYKSYATLKIEATPKGLTFMVPNQERFLPWTEVTTYYLEKPSGYPRKTRYVLEGRRDRFEFFADLTNIEALKALIEDLAVNASTSSWLYRDGDNGHIFGGAASLWSEGQVGIGAKTYHYRTWHSIAMLTGFVFMILVTSVWPILHPDPYSGTTPADQFWKDLPMNALLLVAFAYCLTNYFLAWVRCDESGLHTKGVIGARFLPWKEITKLEFNSSYLVVSASKSKIRILQNIADFTVLKSEVERRTGLKVVKNSNAY